MRYLRLAALGLAVPLAALAAAAGRPDVGPTYAIRRARVVPVVGPVLESGTIIVRDGLIEAVGPADKVAIPEDAEIIEAEGLTAYPGLVSAHTNLFLEEPARPAGERGQAAAFPGAAAAPAPPPDQAELLAFRSLKPSRMAIDGWLKAGVTTVLAAPIQGVFQGQSVLLDLSGDSPATMVLLPAAALHVNFTTARGTYPSSLMGTVAHIRQSFLDAVHYAAAQALYAKSPAGLKRPVYDPFLEALVPYARDRRPVIFQCNNAEDLKRAVRIAEELKLNALLSHANEAWRDAAALKKAGLPLLVTLDFRPPRGSALVSQGEEMRRKAEADLYPANPAALAKAGIPFALTTLGLSDGAAMLRAVQAAIKAGLTREEALQAMTIRPARFLGAAAQIGSLEPGKIANIVLAKGEIFDEKTQISQVFVDGLQVKF